MSIEHDHLRFKQRIEGFKNVGLIGDYDDRLQCIWLGSRRSNKKGDLEKDLGESFGRSGTDCVRWMQLALRVSERLSLKTYAASR